MLIDIHNEKSYNLDMKPSTYELGLKWELIAKEKIESMKIPVVHVNMYNQLHSSHSWKWHSPKPHFDLVVGGDISIDVKFRTGRQPLMFQTNTGRSDFFVFISGEENTRYFIVPGHKVAHQVGPSFFAQHPEYENAWNLIGYEYHRREHIKKIAELIRVQTKNE